ncbi:MAG TPA: hypothetical protein GXX20_08725 [Clostridiaceae bacterium]|nr:hypothetical protein [Clostridiaceae bacterium]
MFFLGCDGGSSKTEFILVNEEGNILSHNIYPSYNYGVIGRNAFRQSMHQAILEVCNNAGVNTQEITHAVFGIPTLGELEEMDTTVPEIIGEVLPRERTTIVNDSVIGWSGSLSGQPGINVVSGTGSIAYGEDSYGNKARAGGWSVLFGDEGSCSWIGKKVLETFFKQSDGRMPRSAIYDIFKEHFKLTKKDIYFVGILCSGFQKKRSNIAMLQLLAEEACKRGDPNMKHVYEEAASELALLVKAVRSQLTFPQEKPVLVSYSGGLFKSGKLILDPFRKIIYEMNMKLVEPKYPPIIGALALEAGRYLQPNNYNYMLSQAYANIQKTK